MAASTCASLFPPTCSSVFQRDFFYSPRQFKRSSILLKSHRLAVSTSSDQAPSSFVVLEEADVEDVSLKDYFEQSVDLIRSDGGPPRWFSPLECASRSSDSPLLLFLPGVDGVGLGLIKHHHRLGKMYDVWCLHIPVQDRTPFTDMIKLVEKAIWFLSNNSPNKPIYLFGESLGACLALSVAARNPDMDLVLILANPATCFSKSQVQYWIHLLELVPDSFHVTLPYILNLMQGDLSKTVMASLEKGHLRNTVVELSQDLVGMSSYLSVLNDILPRETLIWKIHMLKSASLFANSHLHAVKTQTLIICSGKDQLLPSLEEGERLYHFLPNCEIHRLNNSGHFLFLVGHYYASAYFSPGNGWQENGVELVTIIKGARFYRRSKYLDYVADYIPPTPAEFQKLYEPYRWLNLATSPVMISTLGNGNIVRGLAGIPSDGPVLLVGNHMLLGLEVYSLVGDFFLERNIIVRGIAHPMVFKRLKGGMLPELSSFHAARMMGAVPVSAKNFYKLLSSKAHVLLYPGGVREAFHRKGEKYKLFWPEKSEFVRMAARFGAKILPFGAVGEDDVGEVIFDYHDHMKVPFLKNYIEELRDEVTKVRVDADGEVANQDVHCPLILPKLPGRFYFYFGKPIETEGRRQEFRDREKANEVYMEVKREVEKCLEFLRNKRETDAYRNLFPRLLYQSRHGMDAEIPTFEI